MKRILWLIAIGAAFWGLPRLSHPAVDLGKLEPVEAVLLSFGDSGVVMETDTGAKGDGVSLQDAVDDLFRSSGSEVFLDTTAKLLISGDVGTNWETIYALFRPSCAVCRVEQNVDLKEATEYLTIHQPRMNLNGLRAGDRDWQTLRMEEGSGYLEPE